MRRFVVIAALLSASCSGVKARETQAPVTCRSDTDCEDEEICAVQQCLPLPPETRRPVGDPDTTAAPPPEAPAPAPTSAVPAPPTPSPKPDPARPPSPMPTEAASGERPAPGCGCAPDDVMCAMKCAQRGNAVAPGTSQQDCDCPPGDQLCGMRCR